MYLNINIILIILSYQCLMIYGMEKYQSNILSKAGPFDCIVSVPSEGNNMPIPLVTTSTGKPTVIYPDDDGKFIIRHNNHFNMSCAGSEFTSPLHIGHDKLVTTCLNGSLVYRGKNYVFDQFKCRRNPKPTILVTKKICQMMSNRIIEVGFRTSFGFIVLYKVCFDTNFKSTVYAWYFVNPPINNYHQKSVFEPAFIKSQFKDRSETVEDYLEMSFLRDKPGTVYHRPKVIIDVMKVYRNQTNALADIVKSKEKVESYIKKDDNSRRYLAPDHLISQTEFVYFFQQNATYFYENTVPQWLFFSEDIWSEIEKLVIQNAASYNSTRMMASGTYRVSTFTDPAGEDQPFFLHTPEIMPVPLYRWRMDYHVASDTGIVYMALCDPFVSPNATEPMCETIPCPGFERLSAAARKVVFCCTKESFELNYWLDPVLFENFNQKPTNDINLFQ